MIMSQNVPRLHRPVLVWGDTKRKNNGEERVLIAESVPAEWEFAIQGWGGSAHGEVSEREWNLCI